jgi:hypothetical protein
LLTFQNSSRTVQDKKKNKHCFKTESNLKLEKNEKIKIRGRITIQISSKTLSEVQWHSSDGLKGEKQKQKNVSK